MQDYLIDISLQLSRCNSVHVLLSDLAKLRKATALLSLPERCSGMANEANTSVSAPANKKSQSRGQSKDPFYIKPIWNPFQNSSRNALQHSRRKNQEGHSSVILGNEKYKMPKKDHSISISVLASTYTRHSKYSFTAVLHLFVMKQPCLSLKEMLN